MLLRHVVVVKGRRLMGKLVGCKRLVVLRLHSKRIEVLEMMLAAQRLRVEAVHVAGRYSLASMERAFRSR